jgi:hypothetical protein
LPHAPTAQERCTKLERALHAARSEAAAAAQTAAAADSRANALQQELAASVELVQQLEADLVALSTGSSSSNVGRAAAGALRAGSSGVDGLLAADGAGADADAAAGGATAAGDSGSADSGAAAVLAAVTAQRDRFKARLAQVEEEGAAHAQQLQAAAARVEAVTQDNVALVEKLRFLERWRDKQGHQGGLAAPQQQGSVTVIRVDGAGVICDVVGDRSGASNGRPQDGSKAGRYQCGPVSLQIPGAAGGSRRRQAGCFGMLAGPAPGSGAGAGGPEERYGLEYDARLAAQVNPFAEFQVGACDRALGVVLSRLVVSAVGGQLLPCPLPPSSQTHRCQCPPPLLMQASEGEARLRSSMRLHDRALLTAGRLIAGSRLARAALACYVLLLHAVIMAVVYSAASPHAVLSEVSASSGSSSRDGVQRLAAAAAAGAAQGGGHAMAGAVDARLSSA